MPIKIKQSDETPVYASGPLTGCPVFVGGPDTAVQFNDGGAFGGEAEFTYNKTTNALYLTGSFSSGEKSVASGQYSHAEGALAYAMNDYSHAEGFGAIAKGDYSHAEGQSTKTEGIASHAEGYLTTGSGDYSHAEGHLSVAEGYASHAEGNTTRVSANYGHAEGRQTLVAATFAHAEGYLTTGSALYSHAEGRQTTAEGQSSHTEGRETITSTAAIGSHAEGYRTYVTSYYAHTEGWLTTGSSEYSHAEGYYTHTTGPASHAEGALTLTQGYYSHAEGYLTTGSGEASHAEGSATNAEGIGSHAEGRQTLAAGIYSHTEGYLTTGSGQYSHAGGWGTYAAGDYQTVVGKWNVNSNTTSLFVVGTGTSNAARRDILRVDQGSSLGRDSVQITGSISTGNATTVASGLYSHAEGYSSEAQGDYSHSEGRQTQAVGDYSHAEGYGSVANGNGSHAEGYFTDASGLYSHAAGRYTVAGGNYQSVVGQWNESTNTASAFIVGGGSSDSVRKNIFTVTTAGAQIDKYDTAAGVSPASESTYALLFKYRETDSGPHHTWGMALRSDFGLNFAYGTDPSNKAPNLSTRGYLSSGSNENNLDFTGQHRSIPVGQHSDYNDKVGRIVISDGTYAPLSGSNITINDAVPHVKLSSQRNDKRCFGVISGTEDTEANTREYAVGAFVSVYEKSSTDDNRLFINSLGEGCVWVCNINGNLENGDYITTCEIPGYGMKQDDDLLHNYTVAKITCDCDFDLNSTIYKCEEFVHEEITYRRAFVGCTYHCG